MKKERGTTCHNFPGGFPVLVCNNVTIILTEIEKVQPLLFMIFRSWFLEGSVRGREASTQGGYIKQRKISHVKNLNTPHKIQRAHFLLKNNLSEFPMYRRCDLQIFLKNKIRSPNVKLPAQPNGSYASPFVEHGMVPGIPTPCVHEIVTLK